MAKKKKQTEASASSPPTSVTSGGSELYTQAMPDDKFNASKMGFVEFGTSGLRRFSGYIFEDFLNELTGKNAMKTYKEMVYNDPVVSSLIFAIKMMARKTDWYVEPASEDAKDMEASDFLEQCMEDMTRPWKEIVSEVLSMIQYGHAPMEITYKLRQGDVEEPYKDSKFDDGYVGWQSIALRSQDTILKWEFFENGEIKGLWQLAPPFYKLTYIPWEKFLLFRTDYSKNNPEGKSILRAAFRPWMYKKHLEEIEAIGAERGVSGIPIAWVPANIAAPDSADTAAVSALQAYKDLVKNIRRDSQEGIVFPLMYNDKGDKMFDLTLLTTAGSETGKIGEMIERKSREILQVCLAEFIMLGAGKTGSFALSQTKVDLFLQAIGAYLDLIEEVFNTNAVPRLFELNPQFKCDELPKIRHADIKDMDLNNMGNYVAKLIGAGAIQPDDELSNYLRQAAGLPEALEELEVIGPREQAEMQQQQFQANLEAKAGKVAKPKEEEEEPEEGEEEKPEGVEGKEVEKFAISSNTRGNKYHGDDGRFASASGRVTAAEFTGSNKYTMNSNYPDLGPVTMTWSIDPMGHAVGAEAVTEMTFEEYSAKDDGTKQNGIANIVNDIKTAIKREVNPTITEFPKIAMEVVVRSKDRKALATFNTPDLMNSNDLRAQIINNAHYGDKWGKILY